MNTSDQTVVAETAGAYDSVIVCKIQGAQILSALLGVSRGTKPPRKGFAAPRFSLGQPQAT